MLVDTHAHLTDDRLWSQLPAVLERARTANVNRIICVATTAADSQQCLDMAKKHSEILAPTVGIHPNHAAEAQPGDWDRVVALAPDPAVVALGETGLDRHWHDTPFEMQEDYFARHLSLSRMTSRPVVIHTREAEADIIRMLR